MDFLDSIWMFIDLVKNKNTKFSMLLAFNVFPYTLKHDFAYFHSKITVSSKHD